MGRKSKTGGGGKTDLGVKISTTMGMKGIPQTTDAKKTKSINVLQGIVPLKLPLYSETIECSSPNSAGRSEVSEKSSWADQVEEEKGGSHSVESTWSSIVGKKPQEKGIDLLGEDNLSKNVKIASEDI
ncbi:hypothetical protein KY284_027305 [Solanum tuberosum]|nr:hypothetical protein KY284_027305 [Solanum tuberosum]